MRPHQQDGLRPSAHDPNRPYLSHLADEPALLVAKALDSFVPALGSDQCPLRFHGFLSVTGYGPEMP